MQKSICIIACSPRAQGNSDYMATLYAKGLKRAISDFNSHHQGLNSHHFNINHFALRNYNIMPCIACNACFKHSQNQCILSAKDDVDKLFAKIMQAEHVFLAAPIFFYHLPAIAKAFMDRAQQYWARQNSIKLPKKTSKNVTLGLVAARTKGDNLFAGTIWSLKYFFELFNYTIGEKYLFTGHDGPTDFAQDGRACAQIEQAGFEQGKKMLTFSFPPEKAN